MYYRIIFNLMVLLLAHNRISAQSIESLNDKTDSFFKNYVTGGLVDYALIKNNIGELNELIDAYQKTKPNNNNQTKALLINYYNLGVIKLIADNFPISSPQEISDFYNKIFLEYNGDPISLNDLENNIIRREYKDPRVHFVLVCGALGCPPITNFAYSADKLEEQMDEQTKLALNNDEFIQIHGKTVSISEIFKWYKEDFTKEDKNIIRFINKYRITPIDEKAIIEYYPYDWAINDIKSVTVNNETPYDPSEQNVRKKSSTQEFTPSVLYTKGQWEFKNFNNLYSQTAGFDNERNKVDFNNRASYLSSINQVLFGVNSRLNVGFETWIKSVRIDDKGSSPFAIYSFQNDINSRTAISGIGPKVKFQPFKKLSNLSIQTTFLFPVATDQQGRENGKPFLSQDSYISITQIFYDQALGKKFQIFFSVAPWVYINKEKTPNINRVSVSSPVDIFLSYFPNSRITLYMQQGFWPNYGDNTITSWFLQQGLGAKYQIIKGKLEVESSYTQFTMGKNQGAGATYNLGLRYIHL